MTQSTVFACIVSLLGLWGCAPARDAASPPLSDETIVEPAVESDAKKGETWNKGSTLTIGENNTDAVVDRSRPLSESASTVAAAPTTTVVQPRFYGGRGRAFYGGSRSGFARGSNARTTPFATSPSATRNPLSY